MNEDTGLDNVLNTVEVEKIRQNLETIARVLGLFYSMLQGQGLPESLIHALVVENYRALMTGGKKQ